jgi:hypothetical protein
VRFGNISWISLRFVGKCLHEMTEVCSLITVPFCIHTALRRQGSRALLRLMGGDFFVDFELDLSLENHHEFIDSMPVIFRRLSEERPRLVSRRHAQPYRKNQSLDGVIPSPGAILRAPGRASLVWWRRGELNPCPKIVNTPHLHV